MNSLCCALSELNEAFAMMADRLGITIPGPLWRGSLDSVAGRQLKWVYAADADDEEFLKRATLASTLVIDELHPKSLRRFLEAVGPKLHLNDADPPQPLGSRNLLQRGTLVAALIGNVRPDIATIPLLVKQAEGRAKNESEPCLLAELLSLTERIRDAFGPLAFLYDLRTYGGVAHALNKKKAAEVAAQLGLPTKNWHRSHYLRLLNLIAESVHLISGHLEDATHALSRG